jgi:uncharacterized protein
MLYFILAVGLTWLFLLPAIPLSRQNADSLVLVLRILAGAVPALVAIALLNLKHTSHDRLEYWRNLVDIRRLPPIWLATSLLVVPLLAFLSVLIVSLLGEPGLQLDAAAHLIDQPLSIISFVLFILVFGPLPEELGWRGYALPRLLVRWNALQASLVLGFIWALWHLPLFFIVDTYQHGLGVFTAPFWLFNLSLIVTSVLYTWIFNNTSGSTLSAILFHFSQNFTGELLDLSIRAEFVNFFLTFALVILVLILWGPLTLAHRSVSPPQGAV